jgi:Tol biopolymer transport system component
VLLSLAIVAPTWGGFALPSAFAGFPGRDGRLTALESKFDAGLPCGDSGGHRDCGNDDSIVTFRADGSGRRLLTRHVTSDSFDRYSGPAWSPDGRTIAFLWGLGAATIRSDGTHLRLRRPTCCFYSVAWATDGRHLLMGGSATSTTNDGIYELRIRDHRLRRLTHGQDSDPASSANGAIAFVRRAADRSAWIYVIRRRGATPRPLVRGTDPDWSRDGKRLAFARDDGLYTVAGSGRGTKHLTTLAGDREPAWSPSGSRIAFVRYPHIYIVHRDGSHLRQVRVRADPNLFWESPSWQPLR